MDLKAEKFVDRLLSDEAYQQPSDTVKVEDLEMKLPEWFDEKKYNQGRRFYEDFFFVLSATMILGVVAVLAVPSILNILIGSRRSSSVYTAYRRYFSTHQHATCWLQHELKPGTKSWLSLYSVRSRHLQAGRAARLKGKGTVSQRDLSLTLYGFIGFAFLKPDKLGIRQLKRGDWEAYNHCWKVIGHMLGLQDRYNICRDTYEETRQVCQIIQNRVFTPCLENVPEYFEYMTRTMIEGLQNVVTFVEMPSMIFAVKHLADVPGYVYTEQERMNFQNKLRKLQINADHPEAGVESSALVQKCAVEGLPNMPPRMFYIHDYDSMEQVPAFKDLPLVSKYKLAFNNIVICFYQTKFGRIILNYYIKWSLFVATHLPYLAMWKFGIKNAYVNMFKEDPTDNTIPKPNSEYYKPQPPEPWYKVLLSFLW